MESMLNQIQYLAIAFVIFAIFRELICWYWKINEATELLREVRDILRENAARTSIEP